MDTQRIHQSDRQSVSGFNWGSLCRAGRSAMRRLRGVLIIIGAGFVLGGPCYVLGAGLAHVADVIDRSNTAFYLWLAWLLAVILTVWAIAAQEREAGHESH